MDEEFTSHDDDDSVSNDTAGLDAATSRSMTVNDVAGSDDQPEPVEQSQAAPDEPFEPKPSESDPAEPGDDTAPISGLTSLDAATARSMTVADDAGQTADDQPEPAEQSPAVPDEPSAPEPAEPTPRQAQRAATRATKQSLIAQAELIALTAPPATAAADMKALFERWKQAGRTTKSEDDALWARFNRAQDQLFTRLNLLREQRNSQLAEAARAKQSLIATAEEVCQRADLRQAAETMASLMAQWKAIGQARDDQQLWQRFKAAQDTLYQRRNEDRQTSQAGQVQAAATKRAIIAEVQGLVGSPDLRRANTELRDLRVRFRQAGYAGRDLNKKLSNQFDKACQEFNDWAHAEPGRRRETGQVTSYDRRARLVRLIEQTRADLTTAETTLKTTDSSGAKRSHGSSITVLLGQSGQYSSVAADAMRLKVQLADLEQQLSRLDAALGRD